METVFFNEETIRTFFRQYSKGSKSKDYEFLVAIILNRFLEDIWNKPCVIGFKLKRKYSHLLPRKGLTNIVEIASIFKKQIDEDDPIDLVIVPGTIKSMPYKTKGGIGFQLKRFGMNSGKSDTNALIKYLTNISKRYAKTNTSLFLILDTGERVNFKKIQKCFPLKNFPFERVMFMAVSQEQLIIGEIWPNPGMNKYNPREFLSRNS